MVSNNSINIIKELFEKTIGITGGKYFSSSHVKVMSGFNNPRYIYGTGNYTTNTPYTIIQYNYDDVEIFYLRRVTSHLGDTDTFTDYYVKVEGNYLLNEQYQ